MRHRKIVSGGVEPAALAQHVAVADSVKEVHFDALRAVEPSNTQWLEYGLWAQLSFAKELMGSGQLAEASAQASNGCETARILVKRDPSNPNWRKGVSICFLLQGQLALKSGSKAQALDLVQRSVTAARSVHTNDAVDDGYVSAKAYLALGDVERAIGDSNEAQTAWNQALASIPTNVTERSDETAVRATILERLGRENEAAPLRSRLKQVGFERN